jgi:hypothetical protein
MIFSMILFASLLGESDSMRWANGLGESGLFGGEILNRSFIGFGIFALSALRCDFLCTQTMEYKSTFLAK